MKKFFVVLVICVLFTATVGAKPNFGINVGAAIPTGDFADYYENGFTIGGDAIINRSGPVDVAFGLNFTNLSAEYGDSEALVSAYLGPKFGKETGLYFLPAVAANINDGDARMGVDLGTGVLFPVGSGNKKLNISFKFSVLNLVGKEDNEDTLNMFRIGAGIFF